MRVLMVSKACIVGIYQRKLEYIARHEDIELCVVVPPSWKDERGEMPLERVYTEGYRLEVLPIVRNGDFHLHFYRGLGRIMREFKPDVVHIDEEPYNLSAWQMLYHARKQGAKTLFFSWQNLLRRYPPPFSWGESWVLRHVDYAMMGTDSAGAIWREKGYTGEMSVIPQFGTDPELFAPYERPQRPFTIGFIGRLVEEKGVFVILQALKHLKGDWRMRWVGGGTLREEIEAHAQKAGLLDRMTFVGQVASTQMPDEYRQIDVLLLPSLTRHNWKEQFGRVLIEAMACGVPVIGSDSGAIPSVVGDGGLICEEGDSDLLREALARLQNNPALYQTLSAQGRKRVLDYFTHERIAEQSVAVYRKLHSQAR